MTTTVAKLCKRAAWAGGLGHDSVHNSKQTASMRARQANTVSLICNTNHHSTRAYKKISWRCSLRTMGSTSGDPIRRSSRSTRERSSARHVKPYRVCGENVQLKAMTFSSMSGGSILYGTGT